MKCEITFRHMKASDAVRAFVEEKVAKLDRLLDHGVEAKVTLSLERHRHVAHVELVSDGSLLLRGVDRSADLHASIDAAVERMLRQVKRYRQKLQERRTSSGGRVLAHRVYESGPEEPEASTEVARIVKQESIVARSMSLEEALMQMDLLDTEFLVFTHMETQQVNVVYRLPNGQFGLIEAHAAA